MLTEFGIVGAIAIVMLAAGGIALVVMMNGSQIKEPKTEFSEIPGKTNFAEDVSDGVQESKDKEFKYDPDDFD